jgi:hypothetical protein
MAIKRWHRTHGTRSPKAVCMSTLHFGCGWVLRHPGVMDASDDQRHEPDTCGDDTSDRDVAARVVPRHARGITRAALGPGHHSNTHEEQPGAHKNRCHSVDGWWFGMRGWNVLALHLDDVFLVDRERSCTVRVA